MKALDAPYNFVPLAGPVYTVEKPEQITIDLPFRDGLSGHLELAIEALSPLCVGDKHRKATAAMEGKAAKEGEVRFYRLPDDTPAIPGASLRGMIRNVMEIACFAKMALIDDRRFSLRDLTGRTKDDYTKRLANKSKAGWLFFDDKDSEKRGWKIKPCRFGRVTHHQIAGHARLDANTFGEPHGGASGVKSAHPRGSAPRKYALWEGAAGASRRVEVIERARPARFQSRTADDASQSNVPDCEIVPRAGDGTTSGTLVITGQPNPKKKREFVFFETDDGPRELDPKVWQAFVDIHETQHPSVEWQYWRERHFKDRRKDLIPIFYLEEDEKITAIGLAMMFKLGGVRSTHELRNAVQAQPDDKELDLVEAIFGRVGKTPELCLRSRVSFGTARLTNADAVRLDMTEPTVLGSPKPSYFPTYLRQDSDPKDRGRLAPGKPYITYMKPEAQLAGWKRYPVHPPGTAALPGLNAANQNAKQVQIRLQTLRGTAGATPRFTARLRFHNLRPFELGAVLWALRFGERDDLRHAIGMAKPHGFGQLAIGLDGQSLATAFQPNDRSQPAVSLAQCLDDFREVMDRWAKANGIAGGWEESLQSQRLRAMADPATTWPGALRHMTLDPKARPSVNEFVAAKKAGLVLAPYGDPALENLRSPLPISAAPTASQSGRGTPPSGAAVTETARSGAATGGRGARPTATYRGRRCVVLVPIRDGMDRVAVMFANREIEEVPVDELDLDTTSR